ncbi:MAG: hypothetical protein GVY35_13745 [Bacteroidetes bacterium]|jgi:hypothetical protein|nr:hypothetical protein [Bacteroidota bacterium]
MTNPSSDAPHDPEHAAPGASPSGSTEASFEDAAFSSSGDTAREPFSDEGASFAGHEEASSDAFGQSQLAMEMAKTWVRQHQTAAMVGAFAVGAFVGALMRD